MLLLSSSRTLWELGGEGETAVTGKKEKNLQSKRVRGLWFIKEGTGGTSVLDVIKPQLT